MGRRSTALCPQPSLADSSGKPDLPAEILRSELAQLYCSNSPPASSYLKTSAKRPRKSDTRKHPETGPQHPGSGRGCTYRDARRDLLPLLASRERSRCVRLSAWLTSGSGTASPALCCGRRSGSQPRAGTSTGLSAELRLAAPHTGRREPWCAASVCRHHAPARFLCCLLLHTALEQ